MPNMGPPMQTDQRFAQELERRLQRMKHRLDELEGVAGGDHDKVDHALDVGLAVLELLDGPTPVEVVDVIDKAADLVRVLRRDADTLERRAVELDSKGKHRRANKLRARAERRRREGE